MSTSKFRVPSYATSVQLTASSPAALCSLLQLNFHTSVIDGEQIYGNDLDRLTYLRTGIGGKLKVNETTMGLIRKDTVHCPFLNGLEKKRLAQNLASISDFACAANPRGNVLPTILALQLIFVREHNRRAIELAARNSSMSDEELFQ